MARPRRLLIACAIVLVLILAAAYLATPLVIGHLVRSELARRGIAETSLSVGLPTPMSLTVRDLTLGGAEGFTAAAVRVEYTLGGLVSRRIERIVLVRPALHLRLHDGKLSWGGLDPLFASPSPGSSGGLVLPAPITVTDGRILIDTAAGEIATTLDGTLSATAGSAPLTLQMHSPWGEARLEITLEVKPQGTLVQAVVREARLDYPAATIQSITGSMSASLGAASSATAELRLGGISSRFLAVGPAAADGAFKAAFRDGVLDAQLDLAGTGSALDLRLAGKPPQPLRLSASGHGLAVPGWIEAMELSAAADLDPAQDLLSATEGVRISGQAAPEFRKLLPGPMQGANTALMIALEPGFTFARAPGWHAAGRATLSAANGALRLATQADLTVAPDGTLSGTLDTEADADRIAFGLVRVARTKIMAPLRIATGKSISFGLTAPAVVTTEAADLGLLHLDRPKLTLQALAADRPVLVLQDGSGTVALSAARTAWTGRLAGDIPVEIGWTEAAFEGPLATPALLLSGGRLALPKSNWAAEGIALRSEAASASTPAQITVTVAALRNLAKIPMLVPLRLDGVFRPAADGLAFDIRARDAQNRLKLRIEGRHGYDRAAGTARIETETLHFANPGTQPADLMPAFGDRVTDVDGALGLAGTLSWSGQGLTSDLALSLSHLNLAAPFGRITGLDGTIRLDHLLPPATPAGQRLTAAAIDAGLPLSDVALQFRLREGRYLDLEDGRLHLAGGTVTVTPVTLDRNAERNAATFTVTAVDLAPLFALIGFEGLVGTGTLSGTIPVVIADRDVAIPKGTLAADGPGQIRYDPKEPPAALQGGKPVAMALAALRNFHYDRLALTIDRALGGDSLLALHLVGKNPDFYGGYPVEFNLNLSGKLDQILVQGLTGYRIPETLQKRLEAKPEAGAPGAIQQ